MNSEPVKPSERELAVAREIWDYVCNPECQGSTDEENCEVFAAILAKHYAPAQPELIDERSRLETEACVGLQKDRLRDFIDRGGIGKVMEELARPAPAQPTAAPGVPWYYECRSEGDLFVRWWTGHELKINRESCNTEPLACYTDFRLLVPAGREAELRAALAEAIDLIAFFHGDEGWELYAQSPEMKRLNGAALARSPQPLNYERKPDVV